MGRRAVAVELKLAVLLASDQLGHGGVSAACRELGISRDTYYEAKNRFEAGGVEGLLPRSRRPHRSPRQTDSAVEDEIVRLRKEKADAGWDAGAWTIAQAMIRSGQQPPSVATINRVLVRRGLVDPQPQKRPNSATRRFVFAERNGCWQLDGTGWRLADGTKVTILGIEDDCTRRALRHRAAVSENATDAWKCFIEAAAVHGLPAMMLTDNGASFNARRRGWTTELDRNLTALGVRVVSSRLYHPQTCGKRERLNGTVKRWLDKQPPAATLGELQRQLDTFDALYNDRPHQSLTGATPNEAWATVAVAAPGAEPAATPTTVHTGTVDPRGAVSAGRYLVAVGRAWTGATVTVIRHGEDIGIFHGNQLLRHLTADPTKRYQGNGHPRGRKPRVMSVPT
jgi:transposase InsO family protein